MQYLGNKLHDNKVYSKFYRNIFDIIINKLDNNLFHQITGKILMEFDIKLGMELCGKLTKKLEDEFSGDVRLI